MELLARDCRWEFEILVLVSSSNPVRCSLQHSHTAMQCLGVCHEMLGSVS